MWISAWNIIALRDTVLLFAQINGLQFLKQRIFTKTLTNVTNACCLCEYRTVNAWYKRWILKHLNMYLSNKFQGRLSNYNFHLLPIHRFPEILITTVFWNEVKIPRNYPVPKCLYKQETINKNILKERKMPSKIFISITVTHNINFHIWNLDTIYYNLKIF